MFAKELKLFYIHQEYPHTILAYNFTHMKKRINVQNNKVTITILVAFVLLLSNLFLLTQSNFVSIKKKDLRVKVQELEKKVIELESKNRFLKTLAVD